MNYEDIDDDIGYDPRDDEEVETDNDEFEVCARCFNGCKYCLMLED